MKKTFEKGNPRCTNDIALVHLCAQTIDQIAATKHIDQKTWIDVCNTVTELSRALLDKWNGQRHVIFAGNYVMHVKNALSELLVRFEPPEKPKFDASQLFHPEEHEPFA